MATMAEHSFYEYSGAHILKFRHEFQQINNKKKHRIQSFPSWPLQQPTIPSPPSPLSVPSKDRYSDVLPFEETRVKLLKRNSEAESDYINASYISGEVPNSYHQYIACQAPLENTIEDFWRMIWEQNTGVIVMLTALEEGTKNKAHCYWPEQGKVSRFGRLLVCHKTSFRVGDLTIRSLLLRESQSGKKNGFCNQEMISNNSNNNNNNNNHNSDTKNKGTVREVIHIQYENWPDFGIPDNTQAIRNSLVLMSRFKERSQQLYSLDGPVVVHCSAGIGRTGVFLACHISLEKLRNGDDANVQETVELLRKQRMQMVKTEEQYALIYRVIGDALKTNLLRELQYYKSTSGLNDMNTPETTNTYDNNNNQASSSIGTANQTTSRVSKTNSSNGDLLSAATRSLVLSDDPFPSPPVNPFLHNHNHNFYGNTNANVLISNNTTSHQNPISEKITVILDHSGDSDLGDSMQH